MTDLAKLVVRLEAQSAQLLQELDKANRKIDRFAANTHKTLNKWAGNLIGFFSARAIFQFGEDVLKAEDRLNDMAEVTGVSVEQLSRLGYAAGQSGSDIESLNQGLGQLAKNSKAAQKGTTDQAKAFDKLGIEVEDASGHLKDTDELLLEVADRFSQYEDGLAKIAVAQQIFGKSGAELIPFLNKGRDGIEELTKKADQLGITLSSKAAKNADEFNDTLSTLGAVARGVMGRALDEVTPALKNIADRFLDAENNGERFDKAVRVLATGLKLLLSAGLFIGALFDRIGNTLGAAAAALVAVVQGDFSRAVDIVKDSNQQALEANEEFAKDMAAIWTDKVPEAVDDGLSEVVVTVKKRLGGDAGDEVDKAAKRIEDAGKAMTERFLTPMERLQATIKEADQLLAANVITFETWQRAVADAARNVDPFLEAIVTMGDEVANLDDATEQALKDIDADIAEQTEEVLDQGQKDLIKEFDDVLERTNGKTNEFLKEASRNVQDILGESIEDVLENGFEHGAKGALEAFGEMLEKMAIQAIAADIAGKIFGDDGVGGQGGGWLDKLGGLFDKFRGAGGGGAISESGAVSGGGGTGWIDAIANIAGAFFGGMRDDGGPGRPGQAVMIGRGAQPELFVPDTDGEFYPRQQWMGMGGGVTQNIYTQGPLTPNSVRQLEVEAARRQRTASARLA